MTQRLTRSEIMGLLEKARDAFLHDACLTCECFLGYLVQLGIDLGEDVQSLLEETGITCDRTHSCLECESCPPADLFAGYLKEQET